MEILFSSLCAVTIIGKKSRRSRLYYVDLSCENVVQRCFQDGEIVYEFYQYILYIICLASFI